jgi:hypothetical protein
MLEDSLTLCWQWICSLGLTAWGSWLFQDPESKPLSAQACQGPGPATQGVGKTGILPSQPFPALHPRRQGKNPDLGFPNAHFLPSFLHSGSQSPASHPPMARKTASLRPPQEALHAGIRAGGSLPWSIRPLSLHCFLLPLLQSH